MQEEEQEEEDTTKDIVMDDVVQSNDTQEEVQSESLNVDEENEMKSPNSAAIATELLAVVEPVHPPRTQIFRRSRRRKPTVQWNIFYFP